MPSVVKAVSNSRQLLWQQFAVGRKYTKSRWEAELAVISHLSLQFLLIEARLRYQWRPYVSLTHLTPSLPPPGLTCVQTEQTAEWGTYFVANVPVSKEWKSMIVSSRSHINTLSTCKYNDKFEADVLTDVLTDLHLGLQVGRGAVPPLARPAPGCWTLPP